MLRYSTTNFYISDSYQERLFPHRHKIFYSLSIYGLSDVDSIPILEKMTSFLNEKYKKKGKWITTKRKTTIYYDRNGNKIDDILVLLHKPADVRKKKQNLK